MSSGETQILFRELRRVLPNFTAGEFAEILTHDAIRDFVKSTQPEKLKAVTADLNNQFSESEFDSYEVEAALQIARYK